MSKRGDDGTALPGQPQTKRARIDAGSSAQDVGSSSKNAVKLPGNLDVERFALSRRTEIAAMERAMKTSRDSGAQRAFQSLPRHLRRRAASHHIRRLPKRLRARAKQEIINEQVKVLRKKKFRQLSADKRRKLLRFSRLEILHGRQKTKAWLETHIWHAKRMHMIDIWGYRLARTPTEKAYRPSYRAATHGVIVSDVSYYQTIELKGQLEALRQILSSITDAAAVPASSKRFCTGIRSVEVNFYYHDSYPVGLIGPASLIWDTALTSADGTDKAPAALRQLLIRFHPSLLKGISGAIEQSLKAFQAKAPVLTPGQLHTAEETAFRSVGMAFRAFCASEVIGPLATDVIKACLSPVRGTSDVKPKTWRSMPPPSAVPEGTIVALDVYDPRLSFPPKLKKEDQSHGNSAVLPATDLAKNDRFWNASIRKKLSAPRYNKVELDKRRSELLLPGTGLQPRSQDDRVPVMMVQRTIKPEVRVAGTDNRKVSSNGANTIMTGWTLLVPAGWGNAFWHSLAYADTRIGGLRERAQIAFEAGTAHFPDDWAATTANSKELKEKAAELESKWKRKPPAKRVNFDALKTVSPWQPDWTAVCQAGAKWFCQLSDGTMTRAAIGSGAPASAVNTGSNEAGSNATESREANPVSNPQRSTAADAQMEGQDGEKEESVAWAGVGVLLANAGPASGNKAEQIMLSLAHSRKPFIWPLQGALLSKLLEQVETAPSNAGADSMDLLSSDLRALIGHSRAKRGLDALPQGAGKQHALMRSPSLAAQALVKVALKPIRKGTPKYNAMIYILSDSQLQRVKAHIAQQKFHQQPGRPRAQRNKIPAGTDEADMESDDENELEEEEVDDDDTFEQPSSDRVIGYVTTGNDSLARGHGQGIGSVSLLGLLVLMQQAQRSSGHRHELLVLFRNASSRTCRAGTLDILL